MKTYPPIEILKAREKAGRPITDFLDSDVITRILSGIETKLGLRGAQIGHLLEVVTATLLQLEPESALETNLHQRIPELSNEKTKELAADLRDRVLKEAERRVRENITDPRFDWDESVLGPKPTVDQLEERKKRFLEAAKLGLSAEEIRKRAEEDARKLQEQEEKEEAEYRAAQLAKGITPLSEEEGGEESVDTPAQTAPAEETARIAAKPSSISIATQKLAAPSARPVERAEVSAVRESPERPPVPTVPPPSAQPSAQPTPPRKADLYREPID